MSKAKLSICHPQPYEEVVAAKYKDKKKKKQYFIAACGLAQGIDGLAAFLIDPKTGETYPGKVLKEKKKSELGPQWIIIFKKLPEPKSKGTPYFLFVAQTCPKSDHEGKLVVTVEFTVCAPRRERSNATPSSNDLIPIQSPSANSTVTNNFAAWGMNGSSSGPATKGAMCRLGANFPGSPVSGSPLGTWLMQFFNVPNNPGYRLDVSNTNGGAGSQDNITVNSGITPPLPAPSPPPRPPSG